MRKCCRSRQEFSNEYVLLYLQILASIQPSHFGSKAHVNVSMFLSSFFNCLKTVFVLFGEEFLFFVLLLRVFDR